MVEREQNIQAYVFLNQQPLSTAHNLPEDASLNGSTSDQPFKDSILEDSCIMIDPTKTARDPFMSCEICQLTDDLLMNKGPLIPLLNNQKPNYFICKSCLKTMVSQKACIQQNGPVLRYSFDDLMVPGTDQELPRDFLIDGRTMDLVTIPRIRTTEYLVLERTQYSKPKGHIEGFVLKFNELKHLSIGSGDKCNLIIPGLEPVQSWVSFKEREFYISEDNNPARTTIHPYNNPTLDEKSSKTILRVHDLQLTISFKQQVMATSNEFVSETDNNHSFVPIYSKKENYITLDDLADKELKAEFLLGGPDGQNPNFKKRKGQSKPDKSPYIRDIDNILIENKATVNKIPVFPMVSKHSIDLTYKDSKETKESSLNKAQVVLN